MLQRRSGGRTATYKERWMSEFIGTLEELTAIKEPSLTHVIHQLHRLQNKHHEELQEKQVCDGRNEVWQMMNYAIAEVIRADCAFHIALALHHGQKPHKHKEPLTMTEPQNTKQELSREVFEAIRRIEDIGVSISAQAYAYRETVTDHLPLLAKDILRLIDDAQAAGKVFRSVAEIAE